MTGETEVWFNGKVDLDYDSFTVGGVNVITTLQELGFNDEDVELTINGESFAGKLEVDEGYPGYSSWTPGEALTFRVGSTGNVLDKMWDSYFDGHANIVVKRIS